MNKILIDIPHVQQPPNTAMCGAACLEMVYRHMGLTRTMEQIWPCIQGKDNRSGRVNCRTFLMEQDALKHGFVANLISADKPISLIEKCLSENICIIALCRLKGEPLGHFCVITGRSFKGIHLNDPMLDASRGRNRIISEKELTEALRPMGEVVLHNTFLLIAKADTQTKRFSIGHPMSDGTLEEYDAIVAAIPYAQKHVCAYHDAPFTLS